MKREYRLLLIGFLVIALWDSISSIASRQFNFNYALAAAISFFIYGVFGFIDSKGKSLKIGVKIAAALGLFDATVGWLISTLLKANTGNTVIEITPVLWIITAIMVTASAALCGLIGAWLASLDKKKA
ncbi:MAG: hypothetical protein V4592_06890 [Bacteroidota bacterium]